jgi:5'(3')-deoxyribonucleotidase
MTFTKTLYIDMDGVLVDLQSNLDKQGWHQNVFKDPPPMAGAVEAFNELCFDEDYDVYILSTAPWNIPNSWTQKRLWVSKYLGDKAHKRLILCNHKNLLRGDILIDDRTANGAGEFDGELIQFGTEKFPNWEQTLKYLLK